MIPLTDPGNAFKRLFLFQEAKTACLSFEIVVRLDRLPGLAVAGVLASPSGPANNS